MSRYQMRGFVCTMVFLLSQTACSAQTPAALSQPSPGNDHPLTAAGKRENHTNSHEAYGSDYGIRPAYEECMTHQPDDTNTASHRQDCADQEFEFQDARLNRVYREVMNALDARGESGSSSLQLRDAQREWLSQVDNTCAEVAEKAGSAMGPAAQSTCFMDQTAMRAGELERTYKIGSAGRAAARR